MAQRTDQRSQTRTELLCYDKALKLTDHVMSVCKPKDKNVNTKHIPKRNASIGHMMIDCTIQLGADILEANMIYVGKNLPTETRMENYARRIELQEHAKSLTYRIEHIFRVLHFDREFAESTTKYMMDLICETRDLIVAWKDSDLKVAKTDRKSVV